MVSASRITAHGFKVKYNTNVVDKVTGRDPTKCQET